MKAVVEYIGGGPVKFEQFAGDNSLLLVVKEVATTQDSPSQFVAAFDCSVVAYQGMLVNCYGQGESPATAIANYRKKLRGHVLVADPASICRREIQCPRAWKDDMN